MAAIFDYTGTGDIDLFDELNKQTNSIVWEKIDNDKEICSSQKNDEEKPKKGKKGKYIKDWE